MYLLKSLVSRLLTLIVIFECGCYSKYLGYIRIDMFPYDSLVEQGILHLPFSVTLRLVKQSQLQTFHTNTDNISIQ